MYMEDLDFEIFKIFFVDACFSLFEEQNRDSVNSFKWNTKNRKKTNKLFATTTLSY